MTDVLPAAADPLLSDLADVVGPAHVLVGEDVTAAYAVDWSRRWSGPVRAVVRPGSTEEVAAVVRLASDAGAPVLTQGGNTGLVGGSVPAAVPGPAGPPLLLSTRRLTRLEPVDDLAGQVTVGAGVTLGDLRAHARHAGWEYGVDLAARDSATVGGTLATNAGGIRVCRYGMTRAQVSGIEAVLPDGSVVEHLRGLPKDNTGYDLAGLLVGSEGTLGVITAARLRLHRPPGPSTVVCLGVDTFDRAVRLVRDACPPERLLAAEVTDAAGVRLAMPLLGLPWPLEREDHRLVMLVEVEGDEIDLPDDVDAVAALDASDAAKLWSYREHQSEAAATLGVVHKLDVSLPLAAMQPFSEEVRAALSGYPGVTTTLVFGHVLDGNLHLEIAGPAADDEEPDAIVFRLVARYGGSISAEHGVGREKAAYLSLVRSPAELAAMRAIKAAWDPAGLFNPGVVLA